MQITSDRDRVLGARCPRRREGGEDDSRGERERERKRRLHVHTCVRMYTRRETRPHCDRYTHGRNVPPVCRLMPTRGQTRAEKKERRRREVGLTTNV
ncbi:hypothetical protein PUN28_016705 [Cardiocondyla obscurior]|uniref:Uncharacterized protein n=1 Tax=Cardiocondyla obscurior TaxID=286306 RepID=A0AAW2ESJ4_9HYME